MHFTFQAIVVQECDFKINLNNNATKNNENISSWCLLQKYVVFIP